MLINDNFYMKLGIDEAWNYQLLTYPNPAVGCVIVKNGELLSDINTVLLHRGVFTDHINIDRKFKQADLILVMCANNLIIMNAIKQYNNMVQM